MNRNASATIHICTGYPPSSMNEALLASVRLRLALIIDGARSLDRRVTTGWSTKYRDGLVVVGKVSPAIDDQSLVRLLQSIESHQGKIIIDYTDDWIYSGDDRGRLIYKALFRRATLISVPSAYMESQVKKFNPQHMTAVIPDWSECPIQQQTHLNKKKTNLLWFGHPSNLPSFFAWFDSKLENFRGTIHAVTNEAGLNTLLTYAKDKRFDVRGYDWSLENLKLAAAKSSCCIIPAHKRGASENRLITALSLGLPTVADQIPSYEKFNEYFIDAADNKKFLKVLSDPENFRSQTLVAQEKILNRYSRASLTDEWRKLLT